MQHLLLKNLAPEACFHTVQFQQNKTVQLHKSP